jgi:hypothetical protein
VRRCLRDCRAKRNPHLYHYGEQRIECKRSCEHETAHALGLIKLLKHAIAQGHDVTPHIQPMVDMLTEARREWAAATGGPDADTIEMARSSSVRSAGPGNTTTAISRRHLNIPSPNEEGARNSRMKMAAAGAGATMLCYLGHIVPFFQQICTGIEIMLGFSPVVARKDWPLVDLPLLGPVGFEMNLALANRVWARLGVFDGGFGVHIFNEANAEIYFGPVRISVIKAEVLWPTIITPMRLSHPCAHSCGCGALQSSSCGLLLTIADGCHDAHS